MPEGRRGPPRSSPIVPRRLSCHVLHDKPARCCPGAASRSPLPLLTPVRLLRLIINIFAKDLPDIVCVELFPHLYDEPILEFQHMMVCVAVEAPVGVFPMSACLHHDLCALGTGARDGRLAAIERAWGRERGWT